MNSTSGPITPTPPTPRPAGSLAAQAEAVELARVAATAADEKQATDIIVLDVSQILAITDAFVIASANNRRLVRSVAESIEEQIKLFLDRAPLRTEGLSEQQWVLLDYGDVVIHVFSDEMRAFYEIERLYMDAPKIEWAAV
jgi:ribosome-associated protein